MVYAIDFDGTIFDGNKLNEEIVNRIKDLRADGESVFVHTSRKGKALEKAREILKDVELDGIVGGKFYADHYVDDRNMPISEFLRKEGEKKIPVKVVYGPPCSGKSTYARENKGERDVVYDYDRMLADTFNVIMPIITDIVTAVLPVIVQLIEKLLPPVVTIVQKLLPPLLRLLQPVLDLLAPILELLTPIIDLVMAILDPIAELLDGLLTPLIAIVSKLIEGALVPLKQQFTTLSNLLSGTVNAAIALIMNAVDRMKGVFSGLIQFIKGVFTGNWKSAWDGIKKIFANIWEGIKNVFKIPINWIIDGINAFIKGINAIKIPDWVPVVGGKGFNIGTIPRLARGGVLEKGQTGFLEGNGAEAVVPLEKNKKWISSVAKDMDSALGGASGGRVLAVLLDILDAVMGLSEMGVYLDKETLVGGLVEPMDRRLGMIRAQKARA